MIPVLYANNETAFTTRGLGALSDCVSCTVTEELNGGYTLELKYPKNGMQQEYLLVRNIIVAQPNRSKDREAFRIYKVDRRLKDYITVYANQLSYDLSGYVIRPVAIADLAQTIYYFNSQASPFSITTDKTSSTPFYSMHEPASIRSWFGGKEGSLIDVYGGEWEYDFFDCNLATVRGADKGLRISYGVNLAEYIRQNEDNMYSHVMAYYASQDEAGSWTESHGNEVATGATDIHRVLLLDVTSDYQNGTVPTAAQLTTYATNYVTAHRAELVGDSQTITVTPEILNTQEISLGDTVHVNYMDEALSTRVVKTVWDVLADKYTSVVLGTKKTSIAETIKSLSTNGPATGNIIIDDALNGSSTHPVQNKVIKTALDGKQDNSLSGSRYCKMADGTLICWGLVEIPANSDNAAVTFPVAFVDTGYGISCVPNYVVSNVVIQYGGTSTTGVTIYRLPANQYAQPVKWIAIGRWK